MKHLVALDQRLQGRCKVQSREARPFDDVLVVEGRQCGESRHHGQLVATERGRVLERFLQRAVDRREDPVRGEHGANRDVPSGQGLGDGDDVGLEVPVLVAEELARSAEPRLHLVDDQQRLVPPAEFLRFLPVLGRRHVDALPLNRLDDECRHVSLPQLGAQGRDIPEWHGGGARQEVTEPLTEVRAAVQRECPGTQPMEGVVGVENPRAPRGLPGEFDGRLDGLGARVAEEHPVDVVPAPLDQLLRQETRQESAVHLDHVREVEIDGLVERSLESRMAAPECVDAEPREEVEIPVPFGVEQVRPLASDVEAIESDRLEHPGQLVVQVLVVQLVVLAVTRPEGRCNIKWHTSPSRAR